MNCERIRPELVGYHFGVIEEDLRREVEEHLVNCSDCLQNFLALKRDIETAESGPRPSPAVRDRLRASVLRELALPEPRRWSWWERPLAFGFAGVVTLVAMIAVTFLARGPGTPPHGLVDPPTTTIPASLQPPRGL
jgi:anti-sigma factor RsiW